MEQTKRKKKRFWLWIFPALLVLLLGAGWLLSAQVYKEAFGVRYETDRDLALRLEDFEGLRRARYEFPSDQGQTLVGYLYQREEVESPRGIIVFAHGFGGGGQNSYMICANSFAENGYLVFAFDATGNDESAGESVIGLPQGVIDLDYAIRFVEQSGNFPELPIGLFGHSWGGYCVCSVLDRHPEVKAVVACSGFNRASDIIESYGVQQVGWGIHLLMPFFQLRDRLQFGSEASHTALDGFAGSDAAVMILHSADDDTVPIEYGYDKYYETYRDDPRFTFLRLEDRGHECFTDNSYMDGALEDYYRWRDWLEYDRKAEENQERFAAERSAYWQTRLDRNKWANRLDPEIFGQFIRFFDEHLH